MRSFDLQDPRSQDLHGVRVDLRRGRKPWGDSRVKSLSPLSLSFLSFSFFLRPRKGAPANSALDANHNPVAWPSCFQHPRRSRAQRTSPSVRWPSGLPAHPPAGEIRYSGMGIAGASGKGARKPHAPRLHRHSDPTHDRAHHRTLTPPSSL